MAALDDAETTLRWLVLDAEAIVQTDLTALDALDRVRAECRRRHVIFAIAHATHELVRDLEAAGQLDGIGAANPHPTLPDARRAFRAAPPSRDNGPATPEPTRPSGPSPQ